MEEIRPGRGLSPALLEQLTLAILDHSADQGLRMIKTIRSYLDTWETFLQDRHQLLIDHLPGAHHADPSCMEADPASLNRQHWQVHGSDLAAFWPPTRSRDDDTMRQRQAGGARS